MIHRLRSVGARLQYLPRRVSTRTFTHLQIAKKTDQIKPVLGISVRFFSEMFDPFPDTNNSSIDQCLVRAVLDGELRDAETILQAGVDPNSRCPQLGTTPLMLAAEDNKKDIMHLLIKHGAEVNLQDNLGETALMKAARDCHPQAVKVLLDNGAQTDILNYESMKASDVTLSNEIDEILAAHEAGKGMLA